MDYAEPLILRWLTKCDNNYINVYYIHYNILVTIHEHLFNFYRSTDIKWLGTTDLGNALELFQKLKFKPNTDYKILFLNCNSFCIVHIGFFETSQFLSK